MGLSSLAQETLCTVEDVLVLDICTFYIFLILEWLLFAYYFSWLGLLLKIWAYLCVLMRKFYWVDLFVRFPHLTQVYAFDLDWLSFLSQKVLLEFCLMLLL